MSAGVLRIWGRISSVNVQKVVWTADELGIAYERKDAGGAFGLVATPEYRRMNPNSLVPVIEEDGFALWESNAIVRYLAAKHAPFSFDLQDNVIRLNLTVHISDVFAPKEHDELSTWISRFVEMADEFDNVLIDQYGCEPAPETQLTFLKDSEAKPA